MRRCVLLFFCLLACGDAIRDENWDASTVSVATEIDVVDDQNDIGTKFDISLYDTIVNDDYDPDGESSTCKKIDFLFVIDNSQSMNEEQEKLIANFPTFASEISAAVPILESIHLGVVTTDSYAMNPEECQLLGALVTQTETHTCGPYAAGNNFITEEDDISKEFSCAADVGISGAANEQQVDAAISALEGFLNIPGQCNAGFSRKDALAVIVIITDEDIQWTDIELLYEHFLFLKEKDENIVMIVLTEVKGGLCPASELADPVIISFAEQFTNSYVHDICEPDYSTFIQNAIATVDTACAKFPDVPPEP